MAKPQQQDSSIIRVSTRHTPSKQELNSTSTSDRPTQRTYYGNALTREDVETMKRQGRNLAAMRKALGWTQEQVSSITNIPKATIGKYETGAINVPLRNFEILMNVYGYKIKLVKK